MKKLLYLSVLSVSVLSFAQESIRFENSSFKDILAKAKKEKKIVFLDAFASWCGPCKLMEKNIFPDPAVKEYYNANFINSHFDMEKGEGAEIARKYSVRSYPTYLFLNSDGEVVFKGMGYVPANEFIAMGKEANTPFNKSGSIKDQFEKGENNPDFLRNAMKVYANTDMPFAKKVSERYFQVKKDKNFSQEEISMLLYFLKSTDDPNYQIFKNSKEEIIKYLPENVYTQLDNQYRLSKIIEKSADVSTRTINEVYFRTEAEKLVGKDEADSALSRLKMQFYPAVGNYTAFEKAALDYLGNGEGFNAQELISAAYIFADKVNNTQSLKKAVVWAEKSVMTSETPESMFILARLYGKTGNNDGAKMYAHQALNLALHNKVDATAIRQFLDSL